MGWQMNLKIKNVTQTLVRTINIMLSSDSLSTMSYEKVMVTNNRIQLATVGLDLHLSNTFRPVGLKKIYC